MLDEGEYSPSAAASEASVSVSSSKKKMKNRKRFTDEQIRSLESIFQNETKLEPRRKLQLSRELGLHPRQVAIWFQNKRARWKSKQLECDYDVLRANYNALASRFENLKKEKQSLAIQLQKLNNLAQSAAAGSSIDPRLENDDDDRREGESNRRLLLERSEYGSAFLSDDGCGKSTNLFGIEEETDLLTVVEPACSSLTSDEDWLEVHSDGLFDQSSSSNQWWDFWS